MPQCRSYEEVGTYLLDQFAVDLGLGSIEPQNNITSKKSMTPWQIDAKGSRQGNKGVVIIEFRCYTTSRQTEERIGAFAYKIIDTGAKEGIIVNPLELQEGAKKIATSANVINVKLNENCNYREDMMQFINRVMIGTRDTIGITDSVEIEIRNNSTKTGLPIINENITLKSALSDIAKSVTSIDTLSKSLSDTVEKIAYPDMSKSIAALSAIPNAMQDAIGKNALYDIAKTRISVDTLSKSLSDTVGKIAYPDISKSIAGLSVMPNALYDIAKSRTSVDTLSKSLQDMIGKIAYPDISKSIAALSAMPNALQNTMGISAFQDIAKSIANSSTFVNAVETYANPLKHPAPYGGINIDSIFPSYREQYLNSEFDVNIVGQQLAAIGASTDSQTFFDVFQKLPEQIQRVFLVIFHHVLWPIIIGVIINTIITPYVAPYIDQFKSGKETKHETIKNIKSIPHVELDLTNICFINVNRLSLRIEPNKKSEVLDQLHFGQIVIIISKQPHWIEIHYISKNGDTMRGWIYSRYTSKFEKEGL